MTIDIFALKARGACLTSWVCTTQVFLPQPGRPPKMLQPVVSRVIRDRKKFCSLAITDLSTNSVPASGGVKVILLCNRVFKEDLRVK